MPAGRASTSAAPSPRSSSTIWSSRASPAAIMAFEASSPHSGRTGARLASWTVPPREPVPDGRTFTGGGSTWLTGSYDPTSDTLYWATGNPWPDGDDRDRPGDNLYTNCVLALNAKTGELKWHYQFTPHDLKDRDATEPNVLVDTVYNGKPSKLLLHADRNGFFYVLDRTNGHLLLAKPFLRRVDWAKSIGPDGTPGSDRSPRLPQRCRQLGFHRVLSRNAPLLFHGARRMRRQAHRLSRSDRPALSARPQHRDRRNRLGGSPARPRARQNLVGRSRHCRRPDLLRPAQRRLRRRGSANGKTLWQFPTNVRMKASPITYTFAGHQYIAVAAGPNILCFGLEP